MNSSDLLWAHLKTLQNLTLRNFPNKALVEPPDTDTACFIISSLWRGQGLSNMRKMCGQCAFSRFVEKLHSSSCKRLEGTQHSEADSELGHYLRISCAIAAVKQNTCAFIETIHNLDSKDLSC